MGKYNQGGMKKSQMELPRPFSCPSTLCHLKSLGRMSQADQSHLQARRNEFGSERARG